jgi:hypothetical protein
MHDLSKLCAEIASKIIVGVSTYLFNLFTVTYGYYTKVMRSNASKSATLLYTLSILNVISLRIQPQICYGI